jgi:hypothetical protein
MYQLQNQKQEILPRAKAGTVFEVKADVPSQLLILGDERTSFSWNKDRAVVEIKSHQGLWMRTCALPFPALSGVRLEHYFGESDQCHTTIDLCSGEKRYSQTVSIQGIDKQEEVADLLFRIAAVIGWQGYTVRRRSETYIDLALIKDAPPASQGDPFRSMAFEGPPQNQKIPTITSKADDHKFEEPLFSMNPFVPEELFSRQDPITIKEFSLGVVVHIERDLYQEKPDSWFERWRNKYSQMEPYVSAVFVKRRAVSIDWARGQVLFSSDKSSRIVNFSELEGLVLRSQLQPKEGSLQKATLYSYQLEILLSGPDELLLKKEDNQTLQPSPNEPIFRLMVDLARSLSISWRIITEEAPR